MARMLTAPAAELAQGDSIWIISFGFICLVVPAFTVVTCERDCYPDV